MVHFGNDWDTILDGEFAKTYYQNLRKFLMEEYRNYTFTDDVIRLLDQREEPVVFLLWGNNAKAKKALIQHPQHLVLTAAHPSPLSAYHGFFGCKHFSKANAFLREHGLPEIDWSI